MTNLAQPRTPKSPGSWMVLAALFAAAGCSPDSNRTLLRPVVVVRPATLAGRIDFGTGTYPRTLVIAARVTHYVSQNTVIRVVGTHTTPQWDIPASPRLTQLAPGVWVDTLRVPAGALQWKFVTNDNWETPYDYSSPDGSRPDGLENDLGYSTSGSSPVLTATVPANFGNVPLVFQVDETATVPHFKIAPVGQGPAVFTSTVDGSFTIADLIPGDYVLEIRAPGQPAVRRNVTLGENGSDLGTISIGASGGSIHGTLAWDPTNFPDLANPPYPPTTVTLYSGVTQVAQLTTGRTSNQFDFGSLAPGTYRVVADAHLFAETTRDTIVVSSGVQNVPVTLPLRLEELTSQMNLLGSFNGWPTNEPFPDSTAMDQVALGVWEYPNSQFPPWNVTADLHYFKFVTDGSLENPTDLGGDESVTLVVPLTNAETRFVAGGGTAIKAQFTAAGAYRFTLDERRLTFTIQPLARPGLAMRGARR